MYLHIGQQEIISVKDLVGIFNYRGFGVSGVNREFLKAREEDLKESSVQEANSLLLFRNGQIAFSPITSRTLIDRLLEAKNVIPAKAGAGMTNKDGN